jgi:pentapeptide MXKDX repeat protein
MKEKPMSKSLQTLTAAALAFALLAPAAWADDQPKAKATDAQPMNHGQMNHGGMDHSQMRNMDHSKMQGMDHGQMDHGAMHKDQGAKPEAERKDDQ